MIESGPNIMNISQQIWNGSCLGKNSGRRQCHGSLAKSKGNLHSTKLSFNDGMWSCLPSLSILLFLASEWMCCEWNLLKSYFSDDIVPSYFIDTWREGAFDYCFGIIGYVSSENILLSHLVNSYFSLMSLYPPFNFYLERRYFCWLLFCHFWTCVSHETYPETCYHACTFISFFAFLL